ncbi:30S ribosomal protein S17 [Patescibacteria group bacterium]|nr:30S ribosomal protein S17 [Patescibacteria group bacterium]MBU1922185.1 30S ribosomal protein S17 [Patescibacteria group bacterium]
MEQKKQIKRQWTGTVVSTKMQKTIVVQVDRTRIHPKYGKRIKVSKRYKVHSVLPDIKVGDKVIFIGCRPLSRDKRWRLVAKLS